MLKKTMLLPAAVLCLSIGTLSAAAQIEQNPDYEDVKVLYTDSEETEAVPRDLLCEALNSARLAMGTQPLVRSDDLMARAEMRVQTLDGTDAAADASAVGYAHASETVIRGNADLNTALSALMLSERQCRNLADSDYMMIGYACNESQNLWVLLLAKPEAAAETEAEEF